MQTGKPSKAYKWIIGVIAVVVLYILFDLFVLNVQRVERSLTRRLIIHLIVLLIFLVAETLFYQKNRRWVRPSSWVAAHIACLYIAIVLYPAAWVGSIILAPRYLSHETYRLFMSSFSYISFFVFWGSLAVGHLFFIGVMIKTFSAKETFPQNAGNSTNLLDNIAD